MHVPQEFKAQKFKGNCNKGSMKSSSDTTTVTTACVPENTIKHLFPHVFWTKDCSVIQLIGCTVDADGYQSGRSVLDSLKSLNMVGLCCLFPCGEHFSRFLQHLVADEGAEISMMVL